MAELGAGGGSSYPTSIDTDSTLEDSTTEVRSDVPNDLAAAIVAIETELGTDPAGSTTDVKTYLQTEHNADGTHDNTTVMMLAGSQTVTGTKTFPAGSINFSRLAFNGCQAYLSSNQSLNNTTETAIVFDSESWDDDTYHSTSSNQSRLTATTTGVYIVYANVQFDTDSTGDRYIRFLKGGATEMARVSIHAAGGSLTTNLFLAAVMELTATNYVECYAYQASGGALNVSGGEFTTNFGLIYLGA